MKVLILGVALCLYRVGAEAPYPPSGWRPSGPSFDLPEKQTATPQDSYGSPNQNQRNPSSEYGAPDKDQPDPGLTVQGLSPRGQTAQQDPGQLSQGQQTQGQLPQGQQTPGQFPQGQQTTGQFPQGQRAPGLFSLVQRTSGQFSQSPGQFFQGQQARRQFPQSRPASGQLSQGQTDEGQFAQGLPVQEPTPLFTVSPVNGQQYVGSTFNADLRLLEEQLRQQEAQRQTFSNFDTQQNTYRKYQSDANDYDDFRYQQNPSQIPVAESNTRYGAPSNVGRDTRFGSTDNPQNTKIGSPTTVSPTRFGHPSQFPPRPITQSFGEGATPKQTNDEPGIYFRRNESTSPKISSQPAEDDDKEAMTEADGTPQDSQQSPSFQPPANYPNQLVQLALLQQYSSMPFTQPIGQIRAPIYYQPAQAFPSNLIEQSQQSMPLEGQQQFMPRGQIGQQPFMPVGEQGGQIGQQQFMPMGGQQPFMSGGQGGQQTFMPMLGQQGQQQFMPMRGQGQQPFTMGGQSGQQSFMPMFGQAGQQQLMPMGGQSQSSSPGEQERQPQAPAIGAGIQRYNPATYGLLPDRQDGITPPAQRGQPADNFPPPRFNIPNSQQQPAQPGQITQFLLSGNAPGLNPFAELMEAYFTSQRSLQEQRRTQGPQGLQLLDGEPTLRQVLLEDIPSFTQALLSGFAQPSQLDITQPGLSSPRADVMRENIANDGLPASSFQQNVLTPQNAYSQPGIRQPLVQGNENQRFNQQAQPGAIQSGFDANQQGNAVDSSRPRAEDDGERPEEANDDFGTPTADAPGFGDRLPARGFSAYGAPRPIGVDGQPPVTTDVPRTDAEVSPTEDSPSVAVANAVADGRKRKSSKLRTRRIRPLYTVDNTGQLIQLQ